MTRRLAAQTIVVVMLLGLARPGFAADCNEAVRKLISEHTEIALDKIVPRARFKEDLKADDLDIIEISSASELAFDLLISEAEEKRLSRLATSSPL